MPRRKRTKAEVLAELLTPEEVMDVLRISRASFFRLMKTRELPCVKILARIFVLREDLNTYLRRHYVHRLARKAGQKPKLM